MARRRGEQWQIAATPSSHAMFYVGGVFCFTIDIF
jgi:hypothetical protein